MGHELHKILNKFNGVAIALAVTFFASSTIYAESWYLKDTKENRALFYGYKAQSISGTDRLILESLKVKYKQYQSEFNTSNEEYNNTHIYKKLNVDRRRFKKQYSEINQLAQGFDPNSAAIPAPIKAVTNLIKLHKLYGIPVTVLESVYTLGKGTYDLASRASRMGKAEDVVLKATPNESYLMGAIQLSQLAQKDPKVFGEIINLVLSEKIGISILAKADELLRSDVGLMAFVGMGDLRNELKVEIEKLKNKFQKIKEKNKKEGDESSNTFTEAEEIILSSIAKLQEKENYLASLEPNSLTPIQIDQAFNEITSAHFAATEFLKLIDPQAAKEFSSIGGPLISIGQSLMKLKTKHFVGSETGFSVSALAMGNVFALINIFISLSSSDEKSEFQLIAEMLYDALDKRLTELHEAVHKHLDVIHQDLLDGFYALSKMMSKGFHSLKNDIKENKVLLQKIQKQLLGLENWHSYQDDRASRLSQQDTYLKELRQAIDDCIGMDGNPDDPWASSEKLASCIRTAYSFSTKSSKNEAFMKDRSSPFLNDGRYHRALMPPYYDENLRQILSLAGPKLEVGGITSEDIQGLANPWAWSVGTNIFMDMLKRWPNEIAGYTKKQKAFIQDHYLENLSQEGSKIQRSMNALFYELAADGTKKSVRQSLVVAFIQNYVVALRNVIDELEVRRRDAIDGKEDIDVWKDIDDQTLNPKKLQIMFFKGDTALKAQFNNTLSPKLSQMIPSSVAIAARLDLGKIRVTFNTPKWIEVDVTHTNSASNPNRRWRSRLDYHNDYSVHAHLGVKIEIDFISNNDANSFNLGHFFIKGEDRHHILDAKNFYKFMPDEPRFWQYSAPKKVSDTFAIFMQKAPADLLPLFSNEPPAIHVFDQITLSAIEAGLRAKIIEPLRSEIAEGDTQTSLQNNISLLQQTHRSNISESSTQARSLIEKLEEKFRVLSESISENIIEQFDQMASVEQLNGQYALIEAYLSLGLSSSMKTNGSLRLFFHPFSALQLVHGKQAARIGYQSQIWQVGIERLKLLTAFLLGQEYAQDLSSIFISIPALADRVQSVEVDWAQMMETFPIIKEQGLIKQQLTSNETPELIWKTLLNVELFKSDFTD